MKREVSPGIIVVAVVVALALLGGLYYKFMGAGSVSQKSDVASPYGLPTSAGNYNGPRLPLTGRNAITGEPLPARPAAQGASGSAPNVPGIPPGAASRP